MSFANVVEATAERYAEIARTGVGWHGLKMAKLSGVATQLVMTGRDDIDWIVAEMPHLDMDRIVWCVMEDVPAIRQRVYGLVVSLARTDRLIDERLRSRIAGAVAIAAGERVVREGQNRR